MSKAETAFDFFEKYNCAQSVVAAYAGDYGLDKNKALQVALGFGGGMGRLQDTCGAITGAIIVLGLSSGFREEDGRGRINEVYEKVRVLTAEFAERKGAVKCRDLLGCDLLSEEGQNFFKQNNLREKNCQSYIALACELLDKYLAQQG